MPALAMDRLLSCRLPQALRYVTYTQCSHLNCDLVAQQANIVIKSTRKNVSHNLGTNWNFSIMEMSVSVYRT